MTQQGDMTSQDPAAVEPGAGEPGPGSGRPGPQPVWPSPYLTEGQSVPDAYPAPAQPGQPRYGTQGGARPGAVQQPGQSFSPPGPGPAGRYGQSGYQPAYQQPARQPARRPPSYGPFRPAGRLGPGQVAQRDPALAAAWERLLAMTVDWILILAAAFLAVLSPMLRIWHQLESLVNSQALNETATQSAVNNVLQSPATTSILIRFWLIALAIALAYFWALPAAWGATIGKHIVGLRIVTMADRSPLTIAAAGLRAAAFLAGPAVLLLVPDVGLIGGLLWLADGGALLVDPGRRSLHDRVARTAVIRKRWLDQQSRQSPW
jgi:uncharacterized RDD family membrane protein YckC